MQKSKTSIPKPFKSWVDVVINGCFLFLFLLSPLFLFSQNQLVSVDFKNEKIENVLIDLAAENGYEIVFNSSYFEGRTISLTENNQPLISILQNILTDTKVDISIKGKTIILTKRRKIFGYIIDKNTGETLISATAYDPKSRIGALSNDFGFFSMELPFENNELVFSYVGYQSKRKILSKEMDSPIQIKMESSGKFSEIIVTKDEATEAIERELGKKNLITNEVKTLFATGGEPDVFQFLYTQTGITTGPDGLGGVHVRGGDVSHNLFLYDGVKVYAPFHSLGLFSIFDVNQLKHASFSKFGFNPKHGEGLSSVLEMNVKEGDNQHWNSSLSFSTLATHVGIDGPIIKDKTSISIYARRTHLDPIIKAFTKKKKAEYSEEGFSNHYFLDLNAKINHQLGKKDKISLTMYRGKDVYEDQINFNYSDEFLELSDTTRYHVDWRNQLVALKWNHLYHDKLFSNLTFSYTDYKYQSTFVSKYYENEINYEEDSFGSIFRFFSNISDLGADFDFDFFPNNNHHISFGTGYHNIIYRPGVGQENSLDISNTPVDDPNFSYFDDILDNAYSSNQIHFYINDKWRIRKKLHLNFGGRYSKFYATNLLFDESSSFNIFQGSASLRWLFLKKVSANFSFDRTVQPMHLLSTSNIGFPNDLWIPSIENINPAESHQLNLGINWRLDKRFRLSVNAYYKEMKNLIKFQELSSIPSLFDFLSDFWESEVTIGSGISKGIELDAVFQYEKFKGSIAYTLSKTDRKFEDFNNNNLFPFEFDQRHKLTINLYQKLRSNFWLYANWNFYNGINQTLYLSDGPFRPIDNYFPPPDVRLTDINNDQLPNFHRLDIGMVWRKTTAKFGHELNLGIQNIYNRRNIFFTYQEEDPFFPEFNGLKESTALPILPSLMYKITFSTN